MASDKVTSYEKCIQRSIIKSKFHINRVVYDTHFLFFLINLHIQVSVNVLRCVDRIVFKYNFWGLLSKKHISC